MKLEVGGADIFLDQVAGQCPSRSRRGRESARIPSDSSTPVILGYGFHDSIECSYPDRAYVPYLPFSPIQYRVEQRLSDKFFSTG